MKVYILEFYEVKRAQPSEQPQHVHAHATQPGNPIEPRLISHFLCTNQAERGGHYPSRHVTASTQVERKKTHDLQDDR